MDTAKIIGLVDLTTLQSTDGRKEAHAIAKKALQLFQRNIIPASICVYPTLVKCVKEITYETLPIASVSGGFPAGQTSTRIKVDETRYAIDQGADEIDMVINRAKLIEGDDNFVFDEISQVKEACGCNILKVIIESGDLQSEMLIKKATEICIQAGANFVKTSTGKIPIGATIQSAQWIAETVLSHYQKSQNLTGIKLSGGIANIADAKAFINLITSVLGDNFIQPKLFRIGASKLFDELISDTINN